jgi:cation/acetate symporter
MARASLADPISTVSLALAMVGRPNSPHILMRFFTEAQREGGSKSVLVANTCIGYMFWPALHRPGFAVVIVGTDASSSKAPGRRKLLGGGNMVALHPLATGGNVFLGFLAAVTFATIPVSGLGAGRHRRLHDPTPT